jgi:hypothetical protein
VPSGFAAHGHGVIIVGFQGAASVLFDLGSALGYSREEPGCV